METAHLIVEEANQVLNFWFETLTPQQWFTQEPAIDRTIASRFLPLHKSATHGELWHWRTTPRGRLAEIIVLDQFSRNLYRNSAHAYAFDGMALILAQQAISVEADKVLTAEQCAFLYMPFMHSESLAMHDVALQLFSMPGLEQQLAFEKQHIALLKEFGRYPYRNQVLGRESTQAEQDYLANNKEVFTK